MITATSMNHLKLLHHGYKGVNCLKAEDKSKCFSGMFFLSDTTEHTEKAGSLYSASGGVEHKGFNLLN